MNRVKGITINPAIGNSQEVNENEEFYCIGRFWLPTKSVSYSGLFLKAGYLLEQGTS